METYTKKYRELCGSKSYDMMLIKLQQSLLNLLPHQDKNIIDTLWDANIEISYHGMKVNCWFADIRSFNLFSAQLNTYQS